ncbi:putative glycoside hydrolase family 15 protein [Kribbella sp. NBC_01505]|uniref:putative glycoside hydrolase n=1 Tax=Kribbella sp. NBC_01505 TaxID=2903580 RepID=UPI0038652F86
MTDRRTILKAGAAGVLAMSAGGVLLPRTAQAAPLPSTALLDTSAHWATVPLYGHLSKPTDFSAADVDHIVSTYPVVTLEKAQGHHTHGNAEEGCAAGYAQIRARSSSIKILYYWNAAIVWRDYYASLMSSGFDLAWTLKMSDDTPWDPVPDHPSTIYAYDTSNADLRAWWVDQVVGQVAQVGYDGAFIDAIARYNVQKSELVALFGQAKADAVVQGQRDMVAQLRRTLGAAKTVLYNGLRYMPTVPDWNGTGGCLGITDGAMLEHFGILDSASPGSMKGDLNLARNVDGQGKMVAFCGWWSSGTVSPPSDPPASWKDNITFSLASFLCAAGPNSYFHYARKNFSYNEGAFADFPVLRNPLGPPLGAAVQHGYVFTREFEHASVRVDLSDVQSASIQWH